MTVAVGERAPGFSALLCDGETFRTQALSEAAAGGCILAFYGFAFSAIAENWWRRYDRAGWADFDVPVLGVCRDGPYAQNAFLRAIASPFRSFSDPDGTVCDAYGLLDERTEMADIRPARRAILVLDDDRVVRHRWLADDQLDAPSLSAVEAAVADL
jgi:peroxiredoxin